MSEPSFSPQFQAQLATGKYTEWAVGLPTGTLEALLWMIGEYGLRAAGSVRHEGGEMPDVFPSDPTANVRSKEALRTIAAIVSGERMDVEEARHRIRRAVTRTMHG